MCLVGEYRVSVVSLLIHLAFPLAWNNLQAQQRFPDLKTPYRTFLEKSFKSQLSPALLRINEELRNIWSYVIKFCLVILNYPHCAYTQNWIAAPMPVWVSIVFTGCAMPWSISNGCIPLKKSGKAACQQERSDFQQLRKSKYVYNIKKSSCCVCCCREVRWCMDITCFG